MKASRIRLPSAVRTGIFCKLGSFDDSLPVTAIALLLGAVVSFLVARALGRGGVDDRNVVLVDEDFLEDVAELVDLAGLGEAGEAVA